jgi:hypothetical protein
MALQSRWIWKALAAVAVVGVVGGTIWAFVVVRVCNDQLTTDGRVVAVCRHMEATDPPVLAGGLVLLLALGTFFTEISGFGISLKSEVQEVRRTAERAQDQASEAKSVTEAFEETASDLAEGVQHALAISQPQARPGDGTPRGELHAMAEEYNHVRWTMPSGSERTLVMTEIVRRMIAEAEKISEFDVEGYLHTNNAGRRLVAYAYMYAHPESAWVPVIAEAFLTDDKPFNQYWALKALEAQDFPISSMLDRDLIRRLRDRLPRLENDASRHRLLTKLLEQRT